MAEEIRVEMQASPHRVNNPFCIWDHMVLTNGLYMPNGWRFRNVTVDPAAELLIRLPAIPAEIHATTPNGKIRIRWVTSSTDVTNAVKFFLRLSDVLPDTDSYDPATFDLDTSITDVSGGAGRANQVDIAITGANLAAGRELIGVLKRDSSDAADTLGSDILVTGVIFVADKAA